MKKTIKVTKNYEQFSLVKGNRNIDPLHLSRLIKAMDENYVPNPIIVNTNYEIMDGQHRFEACKRLVLPVYFIVSDSWELQDIRNMNSLVKKWAMSDYVQSYKALEKTIAGPYTTLEWYTKAYGMPYECSLQLLNGKTAVIGKEITDKFKKGEFIVNDLNYAKTFGNFLMRIKPYFSHYNKRSFVNALMHLIADHRFNKKVFLERLDKHSMKMRKCSNIKDYVDVLEYVYNCGSREKIRFNRKDSWSRNYQPLR